MIFLTLKWASHSPMWAHAFTESFFLTSHNQHWLDHRERAGADCTKIYSCTKWEPPNL